MTKEQLMQETKATLDDVVSRWAPYPDEPQEMKQMRALLYLASYERDCARVRNGERPIRTNYPLPLPNAKSDGSP